MPDSAANSGVPYRHTQKSPLCLLLYGIGGLFFIISALVFGHPVLRWLFPAVGGLMLVLAASFHHLTVEDCGDRLSIRFGPLEMFRRSVDYDQIVSVKRDRTTLLEGWGIHLSHRGGWVWNIRGRDCVRLDLKRGTLRIGTDDVDGLHSFLSRRIES